ncbi:MAG TPA: hypothetical protein P5555_01505 [Candidatus Paceibacterota bacterium]|nr:hypothetical protein [Verrucomicrobiota bacterium]HRZ43850.1 hypothetical protein [Candidatus Paceibacterota bacterium]HRZ92573.1 hypothetical protein [Candidatus Paceibacterota bacterium]
MRILLAILTSVLWMQAAASGAANLLFELTFNDSGPVTRTTERSQWDWPFEFQTQEGGAADWHSALGGGVSGLAKDRSFDNTASTFMGSDGQGGRAVLQGIDWPRLDSVTFSGWFRTESEVAGRFARLIHREDGKITVYAYPDGGLSLGINHQHSHTQPLYTEINQWVFFAIGYDGTRSADNLVFYKGSRTSPVAAVSTNTMAAGVLESFYSVLSIGNSLSFSRPTQPMDGWLDNLRMHGGNGSSGLATLAELDALRQADVAGDAPPIRMRTGLEARLSSAPGQPNQLTLQWWSVAGYRYQIEHCANLTGWQGMPGAVLDGNGERLSYQFHPPAAPAFYRLRITPAP